MNTIAVRVDNSLKESTHWYTGSGIYRNARLIATNFTHFDNSKGVFVTTPEVTTESATISFNKSLCLIKMLYLGNLCSSFKHIAWFIIAKASLLTGL
jgi:hypothetical protein